VVGRLTWLLLALTLGSPALCRGWDAAAGMAFLVEFLSEGRWRPLHRMSGPPTTSRLADVAEGNRADIDLYVVPGWPRPAGLVLVHGLAEAGKDDPRLRDAARLLARAGWAVAVPSVPGLTQMRLRPADARPVEAAAEALVRAGYQPVALVAVSVGAGPAVIAAATMGQASPPVAPLSAILLLGAYASTRELLRFTLTGEYHLGPLGGTRPVHEDAIGRFARANADLLDAAGIALTVNRDPAQVAALLGALPVTTRQLLDALSPETHLARLRAPLFLVHGRDDPVVPFTESLRLARAARAAGLPARVALVGAVNHVEGRRTGALGEAWRLWTTFYAFRLVATGG
jgi:acetyl esterase/lipase